VEDQRQLRSSRLASKQYQGVYSSTTTDENKPGMWQSSLSMYQCMMQLQYYYYYFQFMFK